MSAPFRLAVIGGGRMGRTHIRALAESDEVDVAVVVEPVAAVRDALAGDGLTVTASIEELADRVPVDGCLVAAPTDRHLQVVSELAGLGIPTLCEKPAGITLAEARAAAAVAETTGTLLRIGYWRRFVPQLVDLKQRIHTGVLGDVHLIVCAQWDGAPPPARFRRQSGGIFIDMGVHEIDQLRWLTGQEIVVSSAVAYPRTADPAVDDDVDSSQALVTLADGAAGVISLGRFHPGGDLVQAEVFAVDGHVRISVVDPESGEAPELVAVRRQTESFARLVAGDDSDCATIDDAIAALTVAAELSSAARLPKQGWYDIA